MAVVLICVSVICELNEKAFVCYSYMADDM